MHDLQHLLMGAKDYESKLSRVDIHQFLYEYWRYIYLIWVKRRLVYIVEARWVNKKMSDPISVIVLVTEKIFSILLVFLLLVERQNRWRREC